MTDVSTRSDEELSVAELLVRYHDPRSMTRQINGPDKPNYYNWWPDLKLIGQPRVTKELSWIFSEALTLGKHGLALYLQDHRMPDEINQHLATWLGKEIPKFSSFKATAMKHPGGGQQVWGFQGLTITFHPLWSNGSIITFNVGPCVHEIVQTKLGNCYNEGRCKKCSYRYRVDSSD